MHGESLYSCFFLLEYLLISSDFLCFTVYPSTDYVNHYAKLRELILIVEIVYISYIPRFVFHNDCFCI